MKLKDRLYVTLIMFTFHPFVKLSTWWRIRVVKSKKVDARWIPRDSPYCYSYIEIKEGQGFYIHCPYLRRYKKGAQTLSPRAGFNWCEYLNIGDDMAFNDECKICGVSEGIELD